MCSTRNAFDSPLHVLALSCARWPLSMSGSSRAAAGLLAILILGAPAVAFAQAASTGVQLAAAYTVRSDVVYHTAGRTELTLDLYVPDRAGEAPIPVVVYYHGGGWVLGDRLGSTLHLLPYLEKGFAVANVSYRLAEAARAPGAVVDALCALRWAVRTAPEFGGDPDRVVLTGRSAGAHLALIAGMLPPGSPLANECASDAEIRGNRLVPARAAAVVNWYGITDVADLLEGPHRRLYAEKWIGGRSDGAQIARSVSPIRHVRRDLPPILTIHGDADPSVPYGHATRLHEALDDAGAVGELITVPQGGHGDFSVERTSEIYARIWTFLGEHGVVE